MYCNNCGKESQNAGRFCPHCGATFGVQNNNAQRPQQTYSQQGQAQGYGNSAYQPEPVYQTAPVTPVSSSAPKKSSSAPVIALVIAIIFIAVFGAFMILEAAGVTEITGWFSDDKIETSVDEDEDEDKDKGENADDADNIKNQEEEDEIEVEAPVELTEDEEAVALYAEAANTSYASSMSTEFMTGSIVAEGTSVVYIYKYTTDVDADASDKLAQTLDSEEMVVLFESIVAEMKAEEPAITSVVVKYFDKNGILLCSREYE